jgi:succinate dehydrogenase/fumarate reductase-like Fe-S protein
MDRRVITAHVFRFDPSRDASARYQTYQVETSDSISAMILMRLIHEQDPTLACRTPMCFKGVCGSCLVRLNGRNVRGCATLVDPGDIVTLEPHAAYELIRDLVVDFGRPRREVPAGDPVSDQVLPDSD